MIKKIKVGKVNTIIAGLNSLNSKKLPAELLRAINSNKKKLMVEADTTEQSKISIIENYCSRDDNGKPLINQNKYVFPDDETEKICFKEWSELLESEVEIDICSVDFALISRCDEGAFDVLTGADYDILEFMIL